jgi:catechol 2,3-dioxygenase-like lactoylglutathione lyase family enzyme
VFHWQVPLSVLGDDGRMIDHLGIQATDMTAAAAFYDHVLGVLGHRRVMDFREAIGYGSEQPQFWISKRPADAAAHHDHEAHIAFAAPDRASVDRFFASATEQGAEVLHEPRLWPEYHQNYYGAFVRDPDGNNVEAVCHKPE